MPKGIRQSRSRAPRGAPACVTGPVISGDPEMGPTRETDHRVRRFRTSACRRSAPLIFFGERRKTKGYPPLSKRAAERWLFDN